MKTLSSSELASRNLPPSTGEIEASVIKKFRDQIHTLGGVWLFFGCLIAAAGVYFSTSTPSPVFITWANLPLAWALFAGLGGTWVTLGVLTCLKKMWAVKTGLILTYLIGIGNILSWLDQVSTPGNNAPPPTIAIAIGVAIILQCHRVVSWANQMQKAGVPLTARPGDYEDATRSQE